MATSYKLVDIALQLADFQELSGSTGDYTYFRHYDGRIIQINSTKEYNNNQLREIADQAKIESTMFMDRILLIDRMMKEREKLNSTKK